MATIPGVSDGELIRTSWGDAVADELNGNTVKKTGTQTMAGPLTVTGLIHASAGVQLPANTGGHPSAVQAVRRDYVEANFVELSGDVMTGALTIDLTAGDHAFSMRSAAPYASWYNAAGTGRYGYILGNLGGMTIAADYGTALIFSTSDTERMRLLGSTLLFGKTATNANVTGLELYGTGRINTTTAASGNENIYCHHISSADAANQVYINFAQGSGTIGGYIAQGPGNNCIFNAGSGGSHPTTSDYRLKDELGPVADPLDRVMQLQPKRLKWKDEPDEAPFDGFIAHEVQAIMPSAVIGAKDAVLPPDHPTDPGGVDPQLLDTSKLVPLLTAALQEANARIDTLTARLDALEAA